jgi:hypothetical protein
VTSETFSKRFADTVDVVAEPIALTFNLVAPSRDVQFTLPVIPQNRSGTHLRCCALLI